MPTETTMAVYYDTEADAAHIALRGGIGPGETVRNVQACDGKVVIDNQRPAYGNNQAGQAGNPANFLH